MKTTKRKLAGDFSEMADEDLRSLADSMIKIGRAAAQTKPRSSSMAEILREQAERPIGIKPSKRPVVDMGGEG